MDLQHKQLQQLTDWLDATEARVNKMEAQPLGPDLENVKRQVEEHKVATLSHDLFIHALILFCSGSVQSDLKNCSQSTFLRINVS